MRDCAAFHIAMAVMIKQEFEVLKQTSFRDIGPFHVSQCLNGCEDDELSSQGTKIDVATLVLSLVY